MEEHQSLSHTVLNCKYHVVFISKYKIQEKGAVSGASVPARWRDSGCRVVLEDLLTERWFEFAVERAAFLTVLHRCIADILSCCSCQKSLRGRNFVAEFH